MFRVLRFRRLGAVLVAIFATLAVAVPVAGADEGFATWDPSFIERDNYTIRLVANGQNIEALRPMLESTAAEVQAVNGVQLSVAPGTIFDREPVRGEVVVVIDPTTNQCGFNDVACSFPRIKDARPTEAKTVIQASKIWVRKPAEFFGYTPEQQRNVIAHEFGHAMGLQHYDQPYVDGMQLMSQKFTSPYFKQGDRNGLLYVKPRPGEFWSFSVASRASDQLMMACRATKYGTEKSCDALWANSPGTNAAVATLGGGGSAVIAFNGVGGVLGQCRVNNEWGSNCWSSSAPIASGASPAVATLTGGAASGTAIAAFSSPTGALSTCQLTTTGPANCANHGWVLAGSSPSIAPLSDGSAVVVFRGASGQATQCRVTWSGGSNCSSTGISMDTGTNAGIAQISTGAAAGTAVAAFRMPTGSLETCQLTSTGFANCANQGWVLAAGTSPTVSPLSDGSVAVGFNGGGGQFSQCRVVWSGGSSCSASNAPMAAGASPASSILAGGTAIAAFRRSSGALGTCEMKVTGPVNCADHGWGVAAGTTPSASPFREGTAMVTFTGGSGNLSACKVTPSGGSNCWTLGSPLNVGTSANPKATALAPAA